VGYEQRSVRDRCGTAGRRAAVIRSRTPCRHPEQMDPRTRPTQALSVKVRCRSTSRSMRASWAAALARLYPARKERAAAVSAGRTIRTFFSSHPAARLGSNRSQRVRQIQKQPPSFVAAGCLLVVVVVIAAAAPRCGFPNRLSSAADLTCDDASCLTSCHRAFVSLSCHCFRTRRTTRDDTCSR